MPRCWWAPLPPIACSIPDGLLPVARVCHRLRLPLVVSEETVTPLADITALHDLCWLQIRGAGSPDRAARLVALAAAEGARGVVVTLLAPTHPSQGQQPGGPGCRRRTRAPALVDDRQRRCRDRRGRALAAMELGRPAAVGRAGAHARTAGNRQGCAAPGRRGAGVRGRLRFGHAVECRAQAVAPVGRRRWTCSPRRRR